MRSWWRAIKSGSSSATGSQFALYLTASSGASRVLRVTRFMVIASLERRRPSPGKRSLRHLFDGREIQWLASAHVRRPQQISLQVGGGNFTVRVKAVRPRPARVAGCVFVEQRPTLAVAVPFARAVDQSLCEDEHIACLQCRVDDEVGVYIRLVGVQGGIVAAGHANETAVAGLYISQSIHHDDETVPHLAVRPLILVLTLVGPQAAMEILVDLLRPSSI